MVPVTTNQIIYILYIYSIIHYCFYSIIRYCYVPKKNNQLRKKTKHDFHHITMVPHYQVPFSNGLRIILPESIPSDSPMTSPGRQV